MFYRTVFCVIQNCISFPVSCTGVLDIKPGISQFKKATSLDT